MCYIPEVFSGRSLSSVDAEQSAALCLDRSVPFDRYAESPLGVLVRTAAATGVRIAEVDRDPGLDREAGVVGHLGALVQ